MSGYRAAPKGSVVIVQTEKQTLRFEQATCGWFSLWGGVSGQTRACLDALYYARTDALESAAQACEAMGATDAAGAVRKLKDMP